jgi:hypothetical protein
METITIGRIVHYRMAVVDYGPHSEHAMSGTAGMLRPAIVVEAEPGVNLMVFTDETDGHPGPIWKAGVVEGTEPGTWHWPERAAAGQPAPVGGFAGKASEQGLRGLPGEAGKAGEREEHGPTGKYGEPGARGAAGEAGKQGERGAPGTTGAHGDPGWAGKAGEPGKPGPAGEAGKKK